MKYCLEFMTKFCEKPNQLTCDFYRTCMQWILNPWAREKETIDFVLVDNKIYFVYFVYSWLQICFEWILKTEWKFNKFLVYF